MSMPTSMRPLGTGQVTVAGDGAPLEFRHPDLPAHRFLLQEASDAWHSAEHRWGTGFMITDQGSGRWQAPERTLWRHDQAIVSYAPTPEINLTVQRIFGSTLTETYSWRNTSQRPVAILSLGLSTPWRDLYTSALDALTAAVHAHVFCGGAESWVLAEPMSGDQPLLGLIVDEGALAAYSIESRNIRGLSNVRGHLLLHPTDYGRNPDAFGGQQPLPLQPGEEYQLAWRVGWYPDRDSFLTATDPPARLDRYAALTGKPMTITGRDGARSTVTRYVAGVHDLKIGNLRTAVLFHPPLADLITARVRFILDHQIARHRAGRRRHAFLAYDNVTGLTQPSDGGWVDWSDGSERLAMPTLLQEVRLRGWPGSELDATLHGFAGFARAHLLDDQGTPRRGSYEPWTDQTRIYDSPWLAHFFATQFLIFGSREDLELAEQILLRSYALGAGRHLSIGQPEAVTLVADLLRQAGQASRAEQLQDHLLDSARHFAEVELDLPAHEVNYEQSIVAPLVSLFAIAYGLDGNPTLLDSLKTALRWLRTFGGPQPHVRLHQIAIRHWDGFWFGAQRQWGDIFPHHWSCLTAVALAQLPAEIADDDTVEQAEAILTANLANIYADGTATCAFTLPSTVDGQPGYRADALANDQDWPLTLWLRLNTPAVRALRFEFLGAGARTDQGR